MLSEYILVGQVLRPQGIDGLVKVRPDTDDPTRFSDLTSVYIPDNGIYREAVVSDVSVREGFAYLRLGESRSRQDAETQRGMMLYVDRAHARSLAENEHFICDLIGCKAFDETGKELGLLTDVMQPGANDVYVFQTSRGEMLLPALKSVVVSTDVENKIMVLNSARLKETAVYERDEP